MRDQSGSEGAFDQQGDDANLSLPGFLLDPVGVLQRRWKLMIATGLLGLVATVVAFSLVKPSYTARASVVVSSQRISEEFFRSSVEGDQTEKINAIVGEILARQQIAKMIQEFDLYSPGGAGEKLSMEEKVATFRENVSIEPQVSTSPGRRAESAVVYVIEFTSGTPEKSASVTNQIARRFTETHLEMRSRQARLTTNFLRHELKQAEIDLSRQERAITEFKQRYRGELPGELQTNLARLDRLQQQRQSLALQIAEAETRLATLASTVEEFDSETPQGRLGALRSKYRELVALYTIDHPNVVSTRRQIGTLEKELGIAPGEPIEAGPQGVAAAARLTLAELQRQLVETVADFNELDARVARTPEREEELVALEQRAEITRENHQEFLRKVSQAELAESVESAQQGERAMIIDTAVPPSKPDRSPFMLILAGLVGSLGLALGSGLLWEILDSVVVAASEIENEFRLPVLGSVSRIR
jgi:uncharacterized protein involved in exopolysaccharide biosynthesis